MSGAFINNHSKIIESDEEEIQVDNYFWRQEDEDGNRRLEVHPYKYKNRLSLTADGAHANEKPKMYPEQRDSCSWTGTFEALRSLAWSLAKYFLPALSNCELYVTRPSRVINNHSEIIVSDEEVNEVDNYFRRQEDDDDSKFSASFQPYLQLVPTTQSHSFVPQSG